MRLEGPDNVMPQLATTVWSLKKLELELEGPTY